MIAAMTPTTTKIMNQSSIRWSVVKIFHFTAAYDSFARPSSFARLFRAIIYRLER
jgi:hypothetical protein